MSEEKVRKSVPKKRGNRTGFTTGACAAAAARAATLALVSGEPPTEVECRLPNGQLVRFPLHEAVLLDAEAARAVVVKDAGDDPDATHGAHLTVSVRRLTGRAGVIELLGGEGVGVVTKPGLGLEVGGPAINPVPRRNITENVQAVAGELLRTDGLEVRVSVPGGEEMAKKTLNARLGIVGGISILGTTGIVRPYSTAAFRASVVQAVDVAVAQGCEAVVFTTGGRTEKFAMRQLPHLPEAAFVQMGDFVKAAFRAAIARRVRHLYVGAMIGKLTKMCQGLAVTHAWKAEVDRDLLAESACEVGAPEAVVEEIRAAETARFGAERLAQLGLAVPFHRAVAQRAICRLKADHPGEYRLTVLVCDFEGQLICRVEEDECV
ncbi:MAG: cobalt-precorrin-5B (C(1))-methyltransferase [Rhodocyclales bacterium]|nr:cobalt-precorrin-5B (C(1))-methyltransferase [Rhodocyclales bacterium]